MPTRVRSMLLGLLVATSCGPSGDPSRPPDTGTPGDVSSKARPRAEVSEADEAAAALDAEIEALRVAWDATHERPEMRRVAERVRAGGRPMLDRLVERLVAGDELSVAFEWVQFFREDAVAPLLAALSTSQGDARCRILQVLESMAPVWRDSASGPAVYRAVLPLASEGDPVDRLARDVLQWSAPASGAIARDLAELWLRHPDGSADWARDLLEELGTDAVAAAPLLLAAARFVLPPTDPSEDEESRASRVEEAAARSGAALGLLRGIGSADPSILDGLLALLTADDQGPVRARVVRVFASWGDAAATAGPDLISLLRDPDEDVRVAAAHSLRSMPSTHDAVWTAIRDAVTRGDAWTRDDAASEIFHDLAKEPEFADRLAGLLPGLPGEAVQRIAAAVGDPLAVAALVAHPDADVRSRALIAWGEIDDSIPLPEGAAEWLRDPDPWNRARAAQILAIRGGAPDAAVRATALPLLLSEDADVRRCAIWALEAAGADHGATRTALLAVLGGDPNDSLRMLAARVLAGGGDLAGREAEAAVQRLGEILAVFLTPDGSFRHEDAISVPRVLLRLPGGAEELRRRVAAVLSSDDEFSPFATATVLEAGPAASALRADLHRQREAVGGPTHARLRLALASVENDAHGIAIASVVLALPPNDADLDRIDESMIRRLLGMGLPGCRALVLLADRSRELDTTGLPADVMAPAILESSRAAPPEYLPEARRRGAIRLTRQLPAETALTVFEGGLDAGLVDEVAMEADQLERRSPGTVPAEFVLRLLERAGAGRATDHAFRLAGRLGPRGAPLVPLLEELRRVDDDEGTAPAAAAALWRITRRPECPQETLRRVLESPDLLDHAHRIDWTFFASAYSEMPLGKPDLDALLDVLLRSQVLYEPHVVALVPLLERFGPDAAPAVPLLRRILAYRGSVRDETEIQPWCYACAARVLGAIGAPARVAIPDLRKYSAQFGFAELRQEFRDAIAKIEAASR